MTTTTQSTTALCTTWCREDHADDVAQQFANEGGRLCNRVLLSADGITVQVYAVTYGLLPGEMVDELPAKVSINYASDQDLDAMDADTALEVGSALVVASTLALLSDRSVQR